MCTRDLRVGYRMFLLVALFGFEPETFGLSGYESNLGGFCRSVPCLINLHIAFCINGLERSIPYGIFYPFRSIRKNSVTF